MQNLPIKIVSTKPKKRDCLNCGLVFVPANKYNCLCKRCGRKPKYHANIVDVTLNIRKNGYSVK